MSAVCLGGELGILVHARAHGVLPTALSWAKEGLIMTFLGPNRREAYRGGPAGHHRCRAPPARLAPRPTR